MRRRSGRFVSHELVGDAYEVDLNVVWVMGDQDVRTRFIRDHCRRGNWSKVPWALQHYKPDETGERKATVRYLFADQTDAMHFKMRFG